MDIELKTCSEDEIGLFLQACEGAFGHEARDHTIARIKQLLEPERAIAARDDNGIVGTAAAYSLSVTIPGGELAAAGVTMVGVLPSHRRRGLLTRMMRQQLEDVRRRGEPIAILWASEAAIYQRFGYGPASLSLKIEVARDRARWLRDATGPITARLLTIDEAVKEMPSIYDEARRLRPGMISRSEAWWRNHRLADHVDDREGGGPMFRVIVEQDGRASAYGLYRVLSKWDETYPTGTLEVVEAVATTARASKDLWRFLFGVDLVGRIRSYFEPVDSSLLLGIQELNRLDAKLHDGLWLRLIDLPAALAARSYASDEKLVLAVEDDLCPWNAGTWSVDVSEGRAEPARSDEEPMLRIGIGDLAAVYLGAFSFSDLERADRAVELKPGAIAVGDRLFRTTIKPWSPEVF